MTPALGELPVGLESVLDPKKGGEAEVRGTQSLRKSAGREFRGCLIKPPHFRDWETEAHSGEGS